MKENLRILVLDDEPIVCERLQSLLEKQGYIVETFTESKAALDRFVSQKFDIVISDLKMSGLDGMDVLRYVQEYSPSTKMIIITGFATVEKAREAMKAGAVDFIAKPFKMSELRDLIHKIANEIESQSAQF